MLEAWLEYHRTTLLLKCEGLNDTRRKSRPVRTSKLSLHGLVRHMAEVERGWFRRTLAMEDVAYLYSSDANPDGEFDDVDTADADEAFATWRAECEQARRIVAARQLDDTGKQRSGKTISSRPDNAL